MALRLTRRWVTGFLVLTGLSAALDPWLVENVEPLPDAVSLTLFAVNLMGVAAISSVILRYFINQRLDGLAAIHGLEKIETVGDAYMAPSSSHHGETSRSRAKALWRLTSWWALLEHRRRPR